MATNIFDEKVRPLANELLKRAKLPDDQIKAGNQKSIFIDQLANNKYQFDGNGQVIVLDANGFELQDLDGHTLTIDQVVQNEFNRYFHISDLPINEAECIARLKDERITSEERRRISAHWNKIKVK